MSLRGVLFAFEADRLASPEGRDAIARCFARYRLGVVSDSPAAGSGPEVQAAFAAHDLHRYFEAWATTADIGDDRRRVVRAALGSMGVQPRESAVVASDPETAAAANSAGCHVVVVAASVPALARDDRGAVCVAGLGDVPAGLTGLAP
ncbi:MAG: hypothetical protein K1X95_15665 [Acidimicrobiia bacterium]|nr:hypothetical protein [Acidimicrobiia bacterium]